MLHFEILGGIRVRTPEGASHEARGPHQRVLLQALLVSEERAVPFEALVEEVWGADAPARVANALQAHISRLRKWLACIEPDRAGTRLVRRSHGYQLLMDDARLDAVDFRAAVARATGLRDRAPDRAAHLLRSALGMWRGPVFGGGGGGSEGANGGAGAGGGSAGPGGLLCSCAVTRYEELRLYALEALFDAELALDRHDRILSELHQAHAENPLRERFCAQLMLALYRSGRQADALAVHRATRDRLARELGIDPTPALCSLEQRILTHAPELGAREEGARDEGARGAGVRGAETGAGGARGTRTAEGRGAGAAGASLLALG